jgi:hypothetical protein
MIRARHITRAFPFLILVLLLLLPISVAARVVRVEVTSREAEPAQPAPYTAAPYEILKGLIYLEVDPQNPANRLIHDLELAPRNARGNVEFTTEFELHRPVNPADGNRRLLYCVNNRGNKHAGYFSNSFGRNWLVDQGWTYLWCGWNCDVIVSDRKLNIFLPVCTDGGETISGRIYTEIVNYQNDVVYDMPLVWGGSIAYPPVSLEAADAVLTRRSYPWTDAQPIPRGHWSFARLEDRQQVPDPGRLYIADGFQPGWLYELVYTGKDPKPTGLGMAAIRDVVTFFRYERADAGGNANPLAGAIDRAYAWGHSQSARLLNHFVYEDFNGDEARRLVFDGILMNCAGAGKGQFNSRFAQMTRHGSHLEDNLYPIDFFPFTSVEEQDPLTGERGDNLARARRSGTLPKLMYINSASDYWTRAASLLHTDVEGKRDFEIDPGVRIYAIAGIAHTEGRIGVVGRALLTALDQWVSEGVEPPASQIPRIADGTLVDLAAWKEVFPAIPGLMKPSSFYHPYRLDPGPRWQSDGIMDNVPPKAGQRYVCLVPQVDADGNEIAGVRLPEVAAPLATFTGWYHRNPLFSMTIGRNAGRVWPFARTAEERARNNDPRPSIEERYPDADAYLEAVTANLDELFRRRLILAEDHERMLREAAVQAGLLGELRTLEEIAADANTEAAKAYFDRIRAANLEWWYGRGIGYSINQKGYELMRGGKLETALSVFELNTLLYPDDFNAWDSLGECCFNMKRFDDAKRYYEKSVELNPRNENGKRMLETIAARE